MPKTQGIKLALLLKKTTIGVVTSRLTDKSNTVISGLHVCECVCVCIVLTIYAVLLLVQLVLMPCEMSSMGGQDKQESLVPVLTDTVAVQRFLVLSQPLPDHPPLQRGVEPKVMADL